MKKLTQKFPAIVAWGYMMRSFPYYIENQCEEANEDNAPRLAIYKREGIWITLDNVTNPSTKHFFRMNYPELANEAWGEI